MEAIPASGTWILNNDSEKGRPSGALIALKSVLRFGPLTHGDCSNNPRQSLGIDPPFGQSYQWIGGAQEGIGEADQTSRFGSPIDCWS